MLLETITFNFSGKVRRAVVNGKQYLVAPMTLIVPGVLNGSKGRLYYPPEEVSKNPAIWNGVPLTLGHPTHPTTNEHQSAKDEGVLERLGLGITKNGRWDGSKLRADGWFDEERTQKLAPDVHNHLINSQPFELSTGLFTENEEKAGDHNGKPYDYIARNYRSDHVAVLVNETGACSVKDGCGVVVNEGVTDNTFSPQARAAALAARKAHQASNKDPQSKIALRSTKNATESTEEANTVGDAASHRVAHLNHKWAAAIHDASAAHHTGLGNTAAAEHHTAAAKAHREAAAEHAKPVHNKETVVENDEVVDNTFSPQARAASIASRQAHKKTSAALKMKLTVKGPKSTLVQEDVGDRHKIAGKSMTAVGKAKMGDSIGAAQDHLSVAKRHEELANKSIHSTEEGRKAQTAHMDAAKAHHEAARAHSATRNEETQPKPVTPPSTEIAVNRTEMLSKLTANCTCDKDKAALNGLSDETLQVLVNTQPPKKEVPVVNATPAPDKSMAERMTPEELQVWNYGRQTMENHKHQLVGRLVANIADPERKKAMTANLLTKGIPELNDLLSLMPPPAPTQNTTYNPSGTDLPPIYLGAAGGDYNIPTQNRVAESVDVVEPWPPVLNYEEHANLPKKALA